MAWDVIWHPEAEKWADGLAAADAEALLAAIRLLRDHGPALSRPLVRHVMFSAHKNMKELRPGSTGRSEVRVLFAFDSQRRAILLHGGDKSVDFDGWMDDNVWIADERFTAHQTALAATSDTDRATKKRKKGKGKR